MFAKAQWFAARALVALVVVMSLGFGLLIAGIAAVLGLLILAALRLALIGAARDARNGSVDGEPVRQEEPASAAQPA